MLDYKIFDKDYNLIEEGTTKYQSADTFGRYAIWVRGKDTKFKTAYYEGNEIKLYEDGNEIYSFLYTPILHVGKWDNYLKGDPRRNVALNEAVEKLKEFRTIRVAFDYEGRTRHEIASAVFADSMKELGYTDLTYNIGYNYEFSITNPNRTTLV